MACVYYLLRCLPFHSMLRLFRAKTWWWQMQIFTHVLILHNPWKYIQHLLAIDNINSRAMKTSSHCFPLETWPRYSPPCYWMSSSRHVSSHFDFFLPGYVLGFLLFWIHRNPLTKPWWSYVVRDFPSMQICQCSIQRKLCVLLPPCGHICVLAQPPNFSHSLQ